MLCKSAVDLNTRAARSTTKSAARQFPYIIIRILLRVHVRVYSLSVRRRLRRRDDVALSAANNCFNFKFQIFFYHFLFRKRRPVVDYRRIARRTRSRSAGSRRGACASRRWSGDSYQRRRSYYNTTCGTRGRHTRGVYLLVIIVTSIRSQARPGTHYAHAGPGGA